MDTISSETINQIRKNEEALLRIFPAEIWETIFRKCDSIDFHQLLIHLPCFRKMLHPIRTCYLFPQVWEIIEKRYIHDFQIMLVEELENYRLHQTRLANAATDELERLLIEIELRRHLMSNNPIRRSYTCALKVRLVCKFWCTVIDSYNLKKLESRKMILKRLLKPEDIEVQLRWMETDFYSHAVIEKFEKMFLETSGNVVFKFVARAIIIDDCYPELFELLERMGQSVWYCTIIIHSRWSYPQIRDALGLLPNLKTLEIINKDTDSGQEVDSVLAEQWVQKISMNPLRNLKKLKALKLSYLPFPIFNELVRRNRQVEILDVDRNIGCLGYDISPDPMPKLTNLSLQVYTNKELDTLCLVIFNLTNLYLSLRTESALDLEKFIKLFGENCGEAKITFYGFGNFWVGLGTEVAAKLQLVHKNAA